MRICIISKYPPIEGGVSSDTYWLARELGERGHEVHVVTNGMEVEEAFRMQIPEHELHLLEPKGVKVHGTAKDFWSGKLPIPKSEYYTEKLTTVALDVCRKYDIELIYSHYLLPYGYVGMVVKNLTSIPHITRHAGSDVGSLMRSPYLRAVFLEIFRTADAWVGSKRTADIIGMKNFPGFTLVNPRYFNPDMPGREKSSVPLLLYIGKISDMKRTHEFMDAAARVKNGFRISFVVGNGKRAEELKKYAQEKGMSERCAILPFVPPWQIPAMMRSARCIVSPENHETSIIDKGVHHPKIVREAMACGRCAIIGEGVSQKGFYKTMVDGVHGLVVDPENIEQFSQMLSKVISDESYAEDIGAKAYAYSKANNRFTEDMDSLERLFFQTIQNRGSRQPLLSP